jgi:uroporphyrinogen decarboxylase
MSDQMTKRERFAAAIRGEPTDRVCVALWKHFPVDDMTADGLASVALNFQKQYDWDLVKFTPTGTYSVMDWGAETIWQANNMGVRTVVKCGVNSAEEWGRLPKLDATKGFYGQQNVALSLLAKEIKGETPILQTVFSPLTTARKLAGERIFTDLRTNAELFRQGMEVITETTIQFALEAIKAGAEGIFFATQLGTFRLLNEAEYQDFGEYYDRKVLSAIGEKCEFILLHVHGEDTMFSRLAQYPANMLNWHDRITAPTLAGARQHFPGLLCGGVNEWNTLVTGPADAIEAEVHDAIAQTRGRGLMIAPGCVVPQHAPAANLALIRRAVEKQLA